MFSTRVLFEDPPQGIIQVIHQTFQILRMHWRPLLSLSALQFGMIFVTGLALFLVTLIAAGSYVASVAAIMQQGTHNYNTRHLIDHAVGISGASRLLGNYYGYNYNYYTGGDAYQTDDFGDNGAAVFLSAAFIGIVLLITVVWAVVFSLVSSIFAGAFSYTIAEIYAGGIPCAKKSFGKGVERMWAVYCYQLFLSLILIIALVLFVVLPVAIEVSHPSAAAMVITIFSTLAFFVMMVLLSTFMTAAIPSIVVENKSAMEGFKRSYGLCKNFFGFIFCSQFCFNMGLFLIVVLINMILDHLPAFFGIIGHFIVNLGISTFGPV